MGALAAAGHPALYDRGWHPTAVCGAVGAAVAAARLLGADAETAGALAALRAGGLRAAFGSDSKSIQVGLAAADRRDRRAARGAGATAPADRIAAAWREAYGGECGATTPADAIARNWIKAWPCCLQTHGAIECAERVDGVPDGPMTVLAHPVSRQAAGYDARRDAAPGQVLDPVHDRLHAPARRPARGRLRRARRRGPAPRRAHHRAHRRGARTSRSSRCSPATRSSRASTPPAARRSTRSPPSELHAKVHDLAGDRFDDLADDEPAAELIARI